MSPITKALEEGYSPEQVLEFLLKSAPALAAPIKKAKSIGYPVRAILDFLGGNEKQGYASHLSESEIHGQRTQRENEAVKKGLKTGATALAGGYLAGRAIQGLPKAAQGIAGAVSQRGIPNIPGGETSIPSSNPTPTQEGMNQQPAAPQPTQSPPSPSKILQGLGVLDRVKAMVNAGNPPELIAKILPQFLSPEVRREVNQLPPLLDLVKGAMQEENKNSIEGIETLQQEPSRGPMSFKTSKGSSYNITAKGTTLRDKALRTEHGEDQGIQQESEKTWYVTPEDAQKLGEFQTQGGGDKKIVELPDSRLGVQYTSGPNQGKVEERTQIKFSSHPEKGLIPVEAWEEGRKIHFGNDITEVTRDKEASKEKTISKEAILPDGQMGTIIEEKQGIAKIKLPNGKTRTQKLDQLHTPSPEFTKNVEDLLDSMPAEAKSAPISFIGYNKETRDMPVQFNSSGDFYIYHDVDQELFDKIISKGGITKTGDPSNPFHAYKPGEESRGAALHEFIKEMEKAGKKFTKFSSKEGYDYFKLFRQAANEIHKNRKRKEPY